MSDARFRLFASEGLRPLAEAPTQIFFSDRLQVADIIQWATSQVGPSRLHLTSFSISEEFLRRLWLLRQEGELSSIRLVLDHKATQKTLKLWHFLAQALDSVYLSASHSKVLLIEGERDVVSVVTSQNLTRGNRIESYAISNDRNVFDDLLEQFERILRFKSIPFSELYARAIAGD